MKIASWDEVAAVIAELIVRKVKSLPPPAPCASVPQKREPPVVDLTSQSAALRPETMSEVEEASEAVIIVVEAYSKREVEEAKIPFLAQIGEVVAAEMTPKLSSHVNGLAPPAEVLSSSQPKTPPLHVSTLLLWQDARPAP